MATLNEVRADRSFFGHPRGLATLFFTEMWERFSYYGIRAFLILFMVASVDKGGMGFTVAKAGSIYGFFTAMMYLFNLPGGWFADRIIGQRKAVLYGGILIAGGNFVLLSTDIRMFYLGLALLIFGTGLLKSNVSTIVGQIYTPEDTRRDSAFSIFYMGINIGALISPLLCGWVAERIAWRMGFGLAGVGMVIGVIQYVFGSKHLGSAGLHPAPLDDPERDRRQKRNVVVGGIVVLVLLGVLGGLAANGTVVLTAEAISKGLGVVLILVALAVFSWLLLGREWSPIERKRSAAVLVLFLASVLFWSAYEQAGSSLNLFAERSTNRNIFGFEFPASWFQFVQPTILVALAPVFAWIWLAMKKREPSSPTKFTLGLVFVGLGFAILVPAAAMSARGAMVSPWWLTGTYFLHTVGELCLSPVGLSAMTKLAPARVAGFMMGLWFFSISIGDYVAGIAASVYESMPLPTLFGGVAGFAVAAGVVLFLLIRPTERLMSGVK